MMHGATYPIIAVLVLWFFGLTANTSNASPVLLHAHDSNANLYTVDVGTGTATLIGNTATNLWDIAFDADGRLFGISAGQTLYKIDSHNSGMTFVGDVGLNASLNALVFDEYGTLWSAGTSDIVTIDPLTGTGSVFATLGQYSSAGDLAFGADWRMYLTTTQGTLLEIDRVDGSISEVGGIADNVFGLARGPDGVMYGLTQSNQLLELDVATGQSTLMHTVVGDFSLGATLGTSFTTESSPEPGSLLLLIGGSFAVFRHRFRYRSRISTQSFREYSLFYLSDRCRR